MEIDFNKCRSSAGFVYNELVEFLNKHTAKFDADELDVLWDIVNDLRSFIGAIMCTYEDGNEKFKNMCGDPELLRFNSDE